MTQIASYVPPLRRPGELGVHSLDHFSLVVPNLAEAEHFYNSFGIDVHEDHGELTLYTAGQGHQWARITEGLEKHLRYLSFGAFEEDFPQFRKKLEREGIPLLPPPSPSQAEGLWFRDPDGILLQVKNCDKSSPSQKPPFQSVSSPPNVRGAISRSQVRPTRPRRLAHVLIFTSNVDRAIKFYSRVLGMRLSDRSRDDVAFMHGIHGSDHHMVAFARSTARGFHHCSWTVHSLDEIGWGALQMADKGFSAGWGLGRHVIGSNYFHYIRDPWGSYCEYSCDIDFIPVDATWDTRDFPTEDRSYLWGAPRPTDFGVNYEAELSLSSTLP